MKNIEDNYMSENQYLLEYNEAINQISRICIIIAQNNRKDN